MTSATWNLYGKQSWGAFIVTTGKLTQQSRDWIDKDNKPIHIPQLKI
jgi:hypothetical protein